MNNKEEYISERIIRFIFIFLILIIIFIFIINLSELKEEILFYEYLLKIRLNLYIE